MKRSVMNIRREIRNLLKEEFSSGGYQCYLKENDESEDRTLSKAHVLANDIMKYLMEEDPKKLYEQSKNFDELLKEKDTEEIRQLAFKAPENKISGNDEFWVVLDFDTEGQQAGYVPEYGDMKNIILIQGFVQIETEEWDIDNVIDDIRDHLDMKYDVIQPKIVHEMVHYIEGHEKDNEKSTEEYFNDPKEIKPYVYEMIQFYKNKFGGEPPIEHINDFDDFFGSIKKISEREGINIFQYASEEVIDKLRKRFYEFWERNINTFEK